MDDPHQSIHQKSCLVRVLEPGMGEGSNVAASPPLDCGEVGPIMPSIKYHRLSNTPQQAALDSFERHYALVNTTKAEKLSKLVFQLYGKHTLLKGMAEVSISAKLSLCHKVFSFQP